MEIFRSWRCSRPIRSSESKRSLHDGEVQADPNWQGLTLESGSFPELDFVSLEAMNSLCTNLSYCGVGIRKIMITSRYASEGKSDVSMKLMRTMARLGRSVVLLEKDLRASGIQNH